MDYLEKAEEVYKEFYDFTHGFRCLFLIQRHKEGGETQNSRLIKKITRNTQEFKEALTELMREKMNSPLPLRIYSCANERDINKAMRKFKFEQLEADFYDDVQKQNFYLDVKNRFIGCMMQPASRKTSYFLFDVDRDEQGYLPLEDLLNQLPRKEEGSFVLKTYYTKNGCHVITDPFNYTKIKMPAGVELKKDGLLLLSF